MPRTPWKPPHTPRRVESPARSCWLNLAPARQRQHNIDQAVASLHASIDIIEATWGAGGLTVACDVLRAFGADRHRPDVHNVTDRMFAVMAHS
jgi:hypothetical protein